MDKFKAMTFLRIFRWEGVASLHLVPWVCFLSAATCKTPKTNSHQPLTPPNSANAPVLAPTKSKTLWYGALKPEVSLRKLPTNTPLSGKGPTDACGVGDPRGSVPQLWSHSGAPHREARKKTKRVLLNCHLKCLTSSFARKCFPSPPYLSSKRDGVASIAPMAFLFNRGMTST